MTAEHTSPDIPPGFAPHFRKSPVTTPWEPLYSKTTDKAVVIGLRIAEPHTNSRGLAHGGLISTLADNAMGLSCGLHYPNGSAALTVSLNIDFLGSAQIGQWLEVSTEFVKPGGTLCFTQCFVTADGKPCARANATFRIATKH